MCVRVLLVGSQAPELRPSRMHKQPMWLNATLYIGSLSSYTGSKGLSFFVFILCLPFLFVACGNGLDSGTSTTSPPATSATLTITRTGMDKGTAPSTSSAGITCGTEGSCGFDAPTETSISLIDTPDTNNSFSSWGGACTGTTPGCIFTLTTTSTVTATDNLSPTPVTQYPLMVGPTSRYLVDQNGKPFLLVGDAAWSMIAALSDSDADFYLEDRRQRGFTAVLVNLIEHAFTANPPQDFYRLSPFTGQTFTTPNETYFAHVDHILKSAAAKGIVVLLDPLYLGFSCGSQGWCAEVKLATTSQMTTWGQYLGNRYANYDNIVWVIGGDTDPTPVKLQVQAMVDGIRSRDARHLFTAHNARGVMAITPWIGAGWLNVNNTYTGSIDYQQALTAYAISPAIPFFLIESKYENEGPNAQMLRAQSYWTVLGGGFGHVFGNCPIWGFGFTTKFCASTDWKAQLNSVGSVNMQHFQALFNSRHWHTLVSDTRHAVLTGGYGSFGGSDYATAAYAADGSSIFAYLPSARTVTVDSSSLAGSAIHAWWYNPGNGVATQIGTNLAAGTQTFLPPTSGDWVLVLDSANFSFPPPGSN